MGEVGLNNIMIFLFEAGYKNYDENLRATREYKKMDPILDYLKLKHKDWEGPQIQASLNYIKQTYNQFLMRGFGVLGLEVLKEEGLGKVRNICKNLKK